MELDASTINAAAGSPRGSAGVLLRVARGSTCNVHTVRCCGSVLNTVQCCGAHVITRVAQLVPGMHGLADLGSDVTGMRTAKGSISWHFHVVQWLITP